MLQSTYPGVYIEEVEARPRPVDSASTSTAVFVGETVRGPAGVPVLVTSWTRYLQLFGGFEVPASTYLPHSVFQFFNNGGRSCYVLRLLRQGADVASADYPPSPDTKMKFVAKGEGKWGDSLWISISRHADIDVAGTAFVVEVRQHDGVTAPPPSVNPVETHDVSLDDESPDFIEQVLARDSKLVVVRVEPTLTRDTYPSMALANPVQLTGGADAGAGAGEPGLAITTAGTNPLAPLNRLDDVSLLVFPGRADGYQAGVDYCENRRLREVFFISDTPNHERIGANGRAEDVLHSDQQTAAPSELAAIYYPWVTIRDPSDSTGQTTLQVPPSGFVAGIYARTDSRRGVWKSPAGVEAALRGAIGLEAELTDQENGILNKARINVLRRFDAGGIVAWGARTRSTDPRLQYLAVRRTQAMIQRSLYGALNFAVFEPNDHRLWSSLRLAVDGYMNGLFAAGAFQGDKRSEAYYVACDLDVTMTQAEIDRGIVVVEVGFAPLKPAEFVIVRVQQTVSQS